MSLRLVIILVIFVTAFMIDYLKAESVALQKLIDGNHRYMEDRLLHPNRSKENREAVAAQQRPFATILGCSDSRVAPEIIFDQGIGDLFVIRVAGAVADSIVLDSVDYSAIYLGSQLILVLGHENCGAVKAVLSGSTVDIEAVASLIGSAIKTAANRPGDKLENAIKANVRAVVAELKITPVIARLIKEGEIEVVGGYYHLTTGEVEILN